MTYKEETLKKIAQDLGITTELKPHKTRKRWIKGQVNGVWVEVEHRVKTGWTLIFAFNHEEAANFITEKFEDLDPFTRLGRGAWFSFVTSEEATERGMEIKEALLEQGFKARENGKPKTEDEGYFEKTAQIIELAVKIQHWDILERGGLGFDAHDGLITVGKTKAVLENPELPTWREHLVPCVMIKDRAVEMFQEGATVPQVAQMIKENLAIVVITQEEQKLVDADYQVAMPAGWGWGDSVFARLDAVGIDY